MQCLDTKTTCLKCETIYDSNKYPSCPRCEQINDFENGPWKEN